MDKRQGGFHTRTGFVTATTQQATGTAQQVSQDEQKMFTPVLSKSDKKREARRNQGAKVHRLFCLGQFL